jgi:3-methyladenine DNA glycosylase/8-oxoguanine DNA glycosylase
MDLHRTLSPPGPVDLRRTLAAVGIKDRSDGAIWWTVEVPSGPATLALRNGQGRAVDVTGWGSGAEEAIERVPRILGFDDDPDSFEAQALRDLHLRSMGLRLGSTGAVFDTVVPAILAQVVTSAEAKTSYRNMVAAFGTQAPGPRPELRLPPSAQTVASLGYEDLHPLGIERKRARVLIEAGRRAKRLGEILSMERDDAYRRLTAVAGIGEWTAARVMGEAWGDRDAVPVGDYNLPSMVTWALKRQRRGNDQEMLELLEPYRPQRRRAVLLLKQSGVKAPRHGPKTPVRKHL